MGKVNIKYIETTAGIPVMAFMSSHMRKPRYAVVDTGSEMTVFDINIGKDLQLVDDEQICSVNGLVETSSRKFTKASINLFIRGAGEEMILIPVDCHATEMSKITLESKDKEILPIQAIIGSDLLNHLEAKIDYDKKILHFLI